MKNGSQDCLTPRHLQLFGAIVQWLARYELLMQTLMAKLAGSEIASAMLLTRRLDFGGKRQALLDLLRHRAHPLDQYDKICAYLLVPLTYTPLLYDITRSVWQPGAHAHLIQSDWIFRFPPGITPLRDDTILLGEDGLLAAGSTAAGPDEIR
ncbi:hypothetical protein [Cupriavidus sp. 8B]